MSISVDEFVRTLVDFDLVTAEELGLWSDVTDVQQLARTLIDCQKITRYQAFVILKGDCEMLTLGNYILLDELGKGATGRVYRARDRLMRNDVAVKVLHSPTGRKRFEREIQLAARLNHPHVVKARHWGEEAGKIYLVMDFVSGPNLAHLVHQNGVLEPRLAMQYVVQAASGLAHAHEHGIIQ